MSLSLFSTIAIILFSYSGFIAGLILARIAPEELEDAKRILTPIKKIIPIIITITTLGYFGYLVNIISEKKFLILASITLITTTIQAIIFYSNKYHGTKNS